MCICTACLLVPCTDGSARDDTGEFTLERTIQSAIAANIELKVSAQETKAAAFSEKIQRSNFLPALKGTYQYKRSKEEEAHPIIGVATPEDEYTLVATLNQPLFLGFSLLNQYKIAGYGLAIAKKREKRVRQNIIFEARKAYFTLLKAQKLIAVGRETVAQIEKHREVAKHFHQVGMTPLNDLLETEVELANAKQAFVIARNNRELAKSNFNILLRRPIQAAVGLKDILTYLPLENDFEYCLNIAETERPEVDISDLELRITEKEVEIGKKDYFPSLHLQGNYYQLGAEWDVDGGSAISDPSGWNIVAIASWNVWEWGKSYYGTKEKLVRLSQARLRKMEIHDRIRLEVKQAYLNTKEAETNISTVETAIEQAKENLRINREQYKEQMATSTDVLDAQTLLTKTMTNYYNALYDFKISKAALILAMGRESLQ